MQKKAACAFTLRTRLVHYMDITRLFQLGQELLNLPLPAGGELFAIKMSTYSVARSVTHNFSKRLNPIAQGLKRAPKPDRIIFDRTLRPGFYKTGVASRLPAAFFKYQIKPGELPPNYHWLKPAGEWTLREHTGERVRADTLPIPVHYPPESQMGLWGGEGIIRGYKKSNRGRNVRFKKFWKPYLLKYTLYSEILGREFKAVTVTPKTLDLIDEAYGFDFYILKTSPNEMRSLLGMKLKRHMLLALARQDSLYPDDQQKKAKILKKYGKFIVPEQEAEWCGLTKSEAIEKQKRIDAVLNPIRPLQDVYTEELVNKLRAANLGETEYDLDTEAAKKRSRPLFERIFGDSSPTEDDKTKR
ncbi:large ribosomal subunit protein bL28m-like [Amphiura filiformis]|uniref:large ribosomal subunit protein bL28m-like n=1 Tax=Amphiura filiformis TaxID=82378 RepID=UPI003B21657E